MTTHRLSRFLLCASAALLVSLAGLSPGAFAVYRGEPDAARHPYAGLAYIYIPARANYVTCSGSLVDAPGLPDRQAFLTAGHCIAVGKAFGGGTRWNVTFDETPEMAFANPISRAPTSLAPDHEYAGTGHTEFSSGTSGVGVGSGKGDYGIIILDTPVDESIVPEPAALPPIGLVDELFEPGGTQAPRPIDMVGYGIERWSTGGGHGPAVVNGAREKAVITMDVLSIQNWNILAQMVEQQGDQTACNGDSGAPGLVSHEGQDTVVALTANGDAHCRATNTMTRVDTGDFAEFLSRLARAAG